MQPTAIHGVVISRNVERNFCYRQWNRRQPKDRSIPDSGLAKDFFEKERGKVLVKIRHGGMHHLAAGS